MRIALLCFGIGTIANVMGMEKVFVEMANAFTNRGHEVWAVWNDEPGIEPFYKFEENVYQVNLNLGKIKVPFLYKLQRELAKSVHCDTKNKVDWYKTNKLVAALSESVDIKSLDIIICFEFNSVMVANIVSKGNIPVVVMVHNSVADQIGKLTKLQRLEANKADVYQVLMPSYVEQAESLLKTRIVFIPNVVPQVSDDDIAELRLEKSKYSIVHIGRIEGHQKRQLILLKAFARLADKYPDWYVDLYGPVGDINYRKEIDRFIKEEKLGCRICYKGIIENSLEILRQADIFAFPSAYEGFSLALTEAMGAGLPVLGFSHAPSVGELIEHEKTGLLASDEADFTHQLERLMKDRNLRVRFGANAHEAMKKYAPEVVWQQWEDLLTGLCAHAKKR